MANISLLFSLVRLWFSLSNSSSFLVSSVFSLLRASWEIFKTDAKSDSSDWCVCKSVSLRDRTEDLLLRMSSSALTEEFSSFSSIIFFVFSA